MRISRYVKRGPLRCPTIRPMDGWRERASRPFKYLKEHEDLTQLDVAVAVGVTQSAVSQWIGDVDLEYRRNPDTLDQYERLARALRMNPADMLYGIDIEDVELYRKITWLGPGQRAAVATIVDSMLQRDDNQETA